MNPVERFRAVMNFQPVDRLPRWEWAMWWDETIARWHNEGLPREFKFSQVFNLAHYFGLDPYQQFWFSTTDPTIEATQHHVEGVVSNILWAREYDEGSFVMRIHPRGQEGLPDAA